MKSILLFAIILLFQPFNSIASSFASWNKQTLTLDNGLVKRIIKLPTGEKPSMETVILEIAGNSKRYVLPVNEEFYFEANGRAINGKSGWNLGQYFKEYPWWRLEGK